MTVLKGMATDEGNFLSLVILRRLVLAINYLATGKGLSLDDCVRCQVANLGFASFTCFD